MDNTLKIQNLCYKDLFRNITFSLQKKSFNVLIGPNGCGKSILVKCIIGYEKYTGDVIVLNNLLNKNNLADFKGEIGFYNEEKIFTHETVLQNLTYPLINMHYTVEDSKKRAYNILKKIGKEDILYKNISSISSLEKKIVLFLTSIIFEPQLIIIDDSFEEIPFYYRNRIVSYLKSLKSTILFVTNNEEDLLYADTILVMCSDGIKTFKMGEELSKNEKVINHANHKLPFIMELSNKLKFYELINKNYTDMEELVNDLWK